MTSTQIPPVRTGAAPGGRAAIAARTLRTDRWWLEPAITFSVLFAFIVYSTVRAFSNAAYFVADYDYISPFYSPCLALNCAPGASHLGQPLPDLGIISPALVVLVVPLGFRLTCYYYRKAYYRAFWLSPPACAVAEPHSSYTGETRFPLVIQNVHRYFFYLGLVLNVILTYDAVIAFKGSDGGIGLGVGTLVLLTNAVLLWLYSLSCHSCRHAVGGRINHFSKHPVRYRMWTWVSRLNAHHMKFAWVSLLWVAFADLYVSLVASGAISDLRLFN
jgi:hypothetical protein